MSIQKITVNITKLQKIQTSKKIMFLFVNLMRKENYTITNLTSKYLYNQHMKRNKKITTLQKLQEIHGQKIVCMVFSNIV